MQLLLVVGNSRFHQKPANPVLHPHRLSYDEIAIPQHPSSITDASVGHIALRKVVAAEQIREFAGIDLVVLLLTGRDSFQHRGMSDLHRGFPVNQMVVDPAGKHGRFHSSNPRLLQSFHSTVQSLPCCWYASLALYSSISFPNTKADCVFVNVKSDIVRHRLPPDPGQPSLRTFQNARSCCSCHLTAHSAVRCGFLRNVLTPTYTFKQLELPAA